MRYLLILLHLVAFTSNTNAQYIPNNQDEDDLKYTFMNIQTSILNENAEKTATYLDQNSIEYLKNTLYVVQNCDSTLLLEQDFTTILTVQFIRFIAPEGKLSTIKDENELLEFLIINNLKQMFADQNIVDIHVENDYATVFTQRDENTSVSKFPFKKEGIDWKYNITNRKNDNEDFFKRPEVIKAYGTSKREIIDKIAEQKGWNKMGRDLWQIIP